MKKTKFEQKYLLTILRFLLLAVALFCVVRILREYGGRQRDIDTFAGLSELTEIEEPDSDDLPADLDAMEETETSSPVIRHDIPLLISQNADCVGWITIDDTVLDYPVMYTPDRPQKYLRMDFYQKYSISGVPFMDYRCTLDSGNLIIFGHNMKNGTMFAPLKDYLQDGYLALHPTIRLETEDGAREFKIFAVATVDKLDPWYSFIHGETEKDFNDAVQQIIQNACLTDGSAPVFGDRLLTLSTCYGSTRRGRLIIIAKEEHVLH